MPHNGVHDLAVLALSTQWPDARPRHALIDWARAPGVVDVLYKCSHRLPA